MNSFSALMRNGYVKSALLTCAVLIGQSSEARFIEYRFEATVSIYNIFPDLESVYTDLEIFPDSTLVLTLIVDGDTEDSFPLPGHGIYRDVFISASLTVGTLSLDMDFDSLHPDINIRNDSPTRNDEFRVELDTLTTGTPFTSSKFRFTLHDSNQKAFVDDSLPISLDISDFDAFDPAAFFATNLYWSSSAIDGAVGGGSEIIAEITLAEVRFVPAPGAIYLLLCALAVVAPWSRGKVWK